MKSKHKALLSIAFLLLAVSSVYFFRENIFLHVGDFLLFSEKPEKADIIVILRGGLLARSIQAAELCNQGYANKILVPTSLGDNAVKQYEKYNITFSTDQENTKSLLQQLSIPEDKIILSDLQPGGGTIGEAYRVKEDLLNSGDKRFIIVTSWYHSKRVHNIYAEIFSDTDLNFWVIASSHGGSNSKNWWHYRHTARTVSMELPRAVFSHFSPLFSFSFQDDSTVREGI